MGKSQIEFLKEIVKLQEENPECDILFFVNNETISEEGSYTKQDICSVGLEEVYYDGIMFYIGEEDIKEQIEYELDNDGHDCSEKVFQQLVEDKYKDNTEKAIIVYFCA